MGDPFFASTAVNDELRDNPDFSEFVRGCLKLHCSRGWRDIEKEDLDLAFFERRYGNLFDSFKFEGALIHSESTGKFFVISRDGKTEVLFSYEYKGLPGIRPKP